MLPLVYTIIRRVGKFLLGIMYIPGRALESTMKLASFILCLRSRGQKLYTGCERGLETMLLLPVIDCLIHGDVVEELCCGLTWVVTA